MKRIATLLIALAVLFSMALPCYAAENGEIVTADVYAKYIRATNKNTVSVENGNASVTTENGYVVSISGAPENAVCLKVVPIPASEQDAWSWFKSCLGDNRNPLAVFDIYFEDSDGNRINANGATISISSIDEETVVFSVATSGNAVELNYSAANGSIAFTANGSHYYVLAKLAETEPTPDNNVTIEDPEGGSVEISDENPEAGDTVTITPVPDEGKEVDKVVVKDEDGKEVPVTNNGDGTYSYVQPDGDVTIEVTFKDKEPVPAPEYEVTIEKTTGGTVTVSDKTPQAGDTVTITVDPNDGKKVSKVTVTDENGKSVKITKNADGTYSYIQPDGDVTIKVTFRDTTIFDNPQTGDNSNPLLWIGMMIISLIAIFWIIMGMRKRSKKEG